MSPRFDIPALAPEPQWLRARAAAAAVLLHGLVLLGLIWPLLWPAGNPLPQAIPVTIVALPPERPPPPIPEETDRYRESGPELGNTPPARKLEPPHPPAAEPAPTPEPPSSPPAAAEAPPLSNDQSAALPLPVPKPSKEIQRKAQARAAHSRTAASHNAGDHYLNAIRDRIEQFRSYPPLLRPLHLEGRAVYAVASDRAGRLLSIRLIESSGNSLLDREGERMIRAAAPFPTVPPDLAPGRRDIEFAIGLHLYPP